MSGGNSMAIRLFALLLISSLIPALATAQNRQLYSYQSGNFNDPNIWTLTNGGTDFVAPNVDDNFTINPGHTITLTANSQIVQTAAARTVTVNGTLNVQTFTTQTFGTIQGTG
ncbi:MAG: hypothetical protein CMR00_09165, partial [[Chlorobium] sp. 445]